MAMRYQLLFSLLFICFVGRTTNVKDFGAVGDGVKDDTQSIETAIEQASDGVLFFPKGRYLISKTLQVLLDQTGAVSVEGGGGAQIIMSGIGPAFHFIGQHKGTSKPETMTEEVENNELKPMIKNLEIIGNHPQANGIELSHTFKFIVQSVLIRDVFNGIHLTKKNRNILIEGSHIYHCSSVGILLDQVNIHQININNCHISYNQRSGVKVEGGEIRNFQITGNDIEYNYALDGRVSADVWIDASIPGSSIREGAITGNTIQAMPSAGGCNILLLGAADNSNKIGLWSITGNHISNQSVNVHMKSVRGVSMTGNTFIRGYDRHIVVEESRNVVLGNNIFDHNDDYFTNDVEAFGGILMNNVQNISCSGMLLDEVSRNFVLEIENGSEISISNCQFSNIQQSAISLQSSQIVNISDCIFKGMKTNPGRQWGVEIASDSKYINVSNNIFQLEADHGVKNDIRSKKQFMIHSNLEVPIP